MHRRSEPRLWTSVTQYMVKQPQQQMTLTSCTTRKLVSSAKSFIQLSGLTQYHQCKSRGIAYVQSLIYHSYENPFITASTRTVIGDIHRLSRRMGSVDVPRPLAVISTLFRLKPLDTLLDNPLFHAVQVWTDVTDISESESFGAPFLLSID